MDFTLHTLGCGSAKPSAVHQPSCTVLDIRGTLYMIDCGEGSQQMFQRRRLKFNRLRHIFLTHLHGDHWLGLPGLLCTLSLTQCTGKITIHTFKEGIEMLKSIMGMIGKEPPYDLEFNEITTDDKEILNNNYLRVSTVKLSHRVAAVGFIFEEKPRPRHILREMTDYHNVPFTYMERLRNGEDFLKGDGTIIPNSHLTTEPTPSVRYAHISDTCYLPELASKIGPADLLLHESTYLDENKAEAHQRGHSTATEAARMALASGAKRLLLTHFSSRYRDDSLFAKEARKIFANSDINYEGLVIKL